MNFLDDVVEGSRERARRFARDITETELRRRIDATPPPPPLVLHANGFDLIAEVKLRSPSAGRLVPEHSSPLGEVWSRARAYSRGGAAAISVLSEPTRFGGAVTHLATAARAASVPVMRKDFLVDPVQVSEARLAGAGGVLIVLRIVDDPTLEAMLAVAGQVGMFVLLEAFDGAELARAAAVIGRVQLGTPVLVGVNARDLSTLEVDEDRVRRLAPEVPRGAVGVAESGIDSTEQASAVARLGYRMALVGTALMGAAHPAQRIGKLIEAGREAACAST